MILTATTTFYIPSPIPRIPLHCYTILPHDMSRQIWIVPRSNGRWWSSLLLLDPMSQFCWVKPSSVFLSPFPFWYLYCFTVTRPSLLLHSHVSFKNPFVAYFFSLHVYLISKPFILVYHPYLYFMHFFI